ncbi:MAG: NUDIX hydrolase [Bdellovibrionales bacterium]|nr:NUDIX hydrolase [Bdellovibrionales bacterium]
MSANCTVTHSIDPERASLLEMLHDYDATDPVDQERRDRFIAFVSSEPDCFCRSLLSGHVTCSAWLLSPCRQKVLLTLHAKLGRWLQLGGHADGNADVVSVALNEAKEESGIARIFLLTPKILDIDIHHIPMLHSTPEHLHYDVRFLLQAHETLTWKTNESIDLKWVRMEQITEDEFGPSLARMNRKAASFLRELQSLNTTPLGGK